METKFKLLDQIEKIKRKLKDQDYKDLLETIQQIPDKQSNKKCYLMEVIIMTPVISNEDGLTAQIDISRTTFELYLRKETRDAIAFRTTSLFERFDTLNEDIEDDEIQQLKNIQKALQAQSTEVSEINDQVIFKEARYLFGSITTNGV